jgi:hypothetical protein
MSIEVNNDRNSDVPYVILHLFTAIACMLIGVHLIALMISTCLLPHIETIEMNGYFQRNALNMENNNNNSKIVSSQHNDDPDACSINMQQIKQPIKYDNTFSHELPLHKFQPYIELSWILSNGVGIVLFLIQLALICYIKFTPMLNASSAYLSGWVVIFIVLIIFTLFSFRFYKLLVYYNLLSKKNEIEILNYEMMNLNNLSKNKKFQIISSKKMQFFHRTSHDMTKKSAHKTPKYPCLSSFNAPKDKNNNGISWQV